ncbi:RNA ligase RtcB family protein [Tepidibacter hydrothermalis]|uniref:3'-phosphate/5'-hydroxy nucleic acid ligase n=1 Tax=Tepidibacter hydrothermalis TaxID=3036126 RepID=A0ABY8ECW4_9FIRM|nr:RNA ligase RtcB family protein [Tepidibacter hydrothermalis]WFD09629.1 RNA ligase RtcB family protein [Tepidibacter hydrothermalis]
MIKIVKSEKSWIESNAVDQLKKISTLKGIIKAVGLPDLHIGKTPVGASYMTKDIIYPHIIGNDIGCGIGLFSTGFKKTKFKIDKSVKKLEKLDMLEYTSDSIKNIDFPFKEKLGTIGSGNHFAEFEEVNKVYDEKALNEIGINKNEIYLLVHSGSRRYGEYILNKYIKEYSCQNGLELGSDAFNEYMNEHNKAVEFAKLNREIIAHKISSCVNSKENKKLLDSVHNSITPKKIQDEIHYIHRKGASPSDIGYVVVAGSRGSNSYIVKPTDNLLDYAFSVSHGAGRKWSRFGCKEKLEKVYSKKYVRQNNMKCNLIYSDKNVIYEEAPEAYKNIERVIQDMVDEKMIEVVASLKPLITYKK